MGSDIFDIELTASDVQQGSNPLARFDLNGDGMSGTIQDFFLAVVVVLGARTIPEAEQMCEELSGSPCDIKSGTALPGVMGATPFPDVTPGSSPTPAPGMLSNVVNTSADDDPMGSNVATCTLREAIIANNQNADFGGCLNPKRSVSFDPNLESMFILNSGLPVIETSLEVQGLDLERTIISGNTFFRIFNINEGISLSPREITLYQGGIKAAVGSEITLSNSAIRNSKPPYGGSSYGGGIYANQSKITIDSSILSGNTAQTASAIGAINNSSILIQNSLIENNISIGKNTTVTGASIEVINSSVINNVGTGINGGSVTVVKSTISGNSGVGNGGGVDGARIIIDSIVTNNTATNGGGVTGTFELLVQNSIISGNSASNGGGGISGAGIIIDSKIINNIAENQGGGVIGGREIVIKSSTISENSAGTGGGVFSRSVYISDTTFSNNSSGFSEGGVASEAIIVDNSLFSSNVASTYGGAVSTVLVGATVTGSIFNGNRAEKSGGAISNLLGGSVSLNFNEFSENSPNNVDNLFRNEGTGNDPEACNSNSSSC